jgi:hypothetical protein
MIAIPESFLTAKPVQVSRAVVERHPAVARRPAVPERHSVVLERHSVVLVLGNTGSSDIVLGARNPDRVGNGGLLSCTSALL